MPPITPSFIPKKNPAIRPEVKKKTGFFFLLSIVIFASAAILHGAAYLYKASLGQKLKVLENSLRLEESAFEPATLVELSRADAKLRSARSLLDRHTTLQPLFKVLEENTLQSVRFKTFGFTISPDQKKIELKMTGDAKDYSGIALQSDAFGEVKEFKDVVFTDLNLLQSGRISFSFSASVDPSLVSFVKNLNL